MKTKLRPPQLLTDLYRDLDDRHLLPVVLLLAVALVAAPILLSSLAGSGSTAPPPAAANPLAGGSDTATQPAVQAETASLTNYRKRLRLFERKNPFHQHFTSPPPQSRALSSATVGNTTPTSGTTTPTSGTTTSTTPISGTTTPTSGTTTGTSTTTTSSGGTSPPTTTTSGSTGSSGGSTTQTRVRTRTITKRITKLVTRRVNVRFGPVGSVQKVTDVQQLDPLPSKASPVVVFMGTNDPGTKAAFLVSSDVTSVSGDGACSGQTSCGLLTLEPGQREHLRYSIDGLTYKLTLVKVIDHTVKTAGN